MGSLTLVVGPRRSGKTSLALRILHDRLPHDVPVYGRVITDGPDTVLEYSTRMPRSRVMLGFSTSVLDTLRYEGRHQSRGLSVHSCSFLVMDDMMWHSSTDMRALVDFLRDLRHFNIHVVITMTPYDLRYCIRHSIFPVLAIDGSVFFLAPCFLSHCRGMSSMCSLLRVKPDEFMAALDKAKLFEVVELDLTDGLQTNPFKFEEVDPDFKIYPGPHTSRVILPHDPDTLMQLTMNNIVHRCRKKKAGEDQDDLHRWRTVLPRELHTRLETRLARARRWDADIAAISDEDAIRMLGHLP